MRRAAHGRWVIGFLWLLGLAAIAAAWKWTPLAQWADPDRISAYLEPLRKSWYGLPAVVLVFVVAELALFPVLVLIVVCGIAFGPVLGPIYALAGSLASAVPPFLLGRKLGRARVERIAGSLVRRISGKLESRGVVAIFLLRKVPAPYTLVNLVCGTSRVSLRDFMLGTLLGMGTGVLLLTVVGAQLFDLVRDPRPAPLIGSIALLFAPLALALATQRFLNRRARPERDAKSDDPASEPAHGAQGDAAPADPAPEPALAPQTDASPDGILLPGENCWRIERAERFHCIQDADEHFRLVRTALLSARRSVFILGWDILAGLDLAPGSEGEQAPTKLAALLDHVARQNPELEVYVLIWDYAALYVFERDPLTRIRFGLSTHERVKFRFDDLHPVAGSHHQKVVVVDDRIAFSGGIDLTGHRWDTAEHRVEEPRRVNATGEPYEPYHDVQALVEGPVAAALGALARERWTRLGVRDLPPLAPRRESLWPEGVPVDLRDVDIAIARTEPSFRGRPAVRECEALFRAEIAAAKRLVYLEHQYMTNVELGEALAARLRERDGPEVIVVGPRDCSGWLEQKTMGVRRHQVLVNLLDADLHGRLRLLYPAASKSRGVSTFVHSKVLAIDDEHLRIGSANLSSRSMGMDTECDLVVTARGEPALRKKIAHLRDRLVAEHFGLEADAVTDALRRCGSLRAAIDELAAGDRALAPVEVERDREPETWNPIGFAVDPAEPIAVSRTIDRLLPAIEVDDSRKAMRAIFVTVCAAGALAIAMHGARGAASLDAQNVRDLLTRLASDAPGANWIFAALVAGGLLFVPFEILVLAPVVLLAPLHGSALAVAAGVVCATAGYLLGRALGPKRIAPLLAPRARNAWRAFGRYGILSVATVRFVAMFSATSVHVLCGAAKVGLRDYALGTLLGLAPALLTSIALGTLLRRAILEPSPARVLLTMAAALAVATFVLRIRRIVLMRAHGEAAREQRERSVYG